MFGSDNAVPISIIETAENYKCYVRAFDILAEIVIVLKIHQNG
jgi:hypothetical protein